MRTPLLSATLAIALATYAATPPSALAQESKKETASVSGRVTLGDRPMPGVLVMLETPERGPFQRTPPVRATTDEDGRYRLRGVPAGSYRIAPFTPAFVLAAETPYAQPGKTVTLSDGEEVEGIDFSLSRGGVITGRVTDAAGRPAMEQQVSLSRVDERGLVLPRSNSSSYSVSTDDRGVYRAYGLAAGRYRVSVGDAPDSGNIRIGFGGAGYARTFHPDVTEESRAGVIEVSAGGETAHVDIKLGRPSKTYVATGRILEADSGKPLPNLQYGHGALMREQPVIGSYGWSRNRTNENGEFRIDGIDPGRYAAFVAGPEQVDFYSEPAVFEITDADVGGLEIKVRRGSTISGIAVIEGSDDPGVLAKLSNLSLAVFTQTEDISAPRMTPTQILPDGSFRMTGLRPGKARITFGYNPSSQKGFSILRVERHGVEQRDGIEVGRDENVTGVRLVIGYGTGTVRGLVRVDGGPATPDMRFRAMARRLGSATPVSASAMVDARGRFILENLMPGDYEIVVSPMFPAPAPAPAPTPGRSSARILAKANVTVTDFGEAEVTLVVNLAVKDKDGEK